MKRVPGSNHSLTIDESSHLLLVQQLPGQFQHFHQLIRSLHLDLVLLAREAAVLLEEGEEARVVHHHLQSGE